MRFGRRALLLISMLAAACPAAASPDEDVLGKAQGYPVAPSLGQTRREPYVVGSFSGMEKIAETCRMSPAAVPRPLPAAPAGAPLTYRYKGADYTLDDYMAHQRITGLIVLHDGAIVAERYGYDRTPDMRFLSNSMAKTVTALALLKAQEEGRIRSLDDRAQDYVPELSGSLYGGTRLVDLMRMASGARFPETYTPDDDRAAFNRIMSRTGTVAALKSVTERAVPAGEAFNYAGAQTQALGVVLRAATGDTLCHYVERTLWQPMGAESPASWILNRSDHVEIAQGGLNATLHDYARLGLLLADDGMVAGQPVLSREHLLDMTAAERQPEAFRPGRMNWHGSTYFGYGLQVWLWPGSHRRFALLGIHGQSIFVDPDLKLVIVQTAVGKDAAGDASGAHLGAERGALFRGIVARYGSW